MNFLKFYIIVLLLFFNTCSNQQALKDDTVKEVTIPNIIEKKNNINFQLKNGILYFDDVPYSGVVHEFYPNNTLKSSSQYYQGKRHGFYKGWYDNNQKWFERFYTNNLKTGTHLGWFENGTKKFYYEFDTEGRYDGLVKNWFATGTLAKVFNFENGKETGSQKTWDVNGKISANFFTVNGERHGLIGLKKCVSVVTNK